MTGKLILNNHTCCQVLHVYQVLSSCSDIQFYVGIICHEMANILYSIGLNREVVSGGYIIYSLETDDHHMTLDRVHGICGGLIRQVSLYNIANSNLNSSIFFAVR